MALVAALLVFISVTGILAAIMLRSPEARAIEGRLSQLAGPGPAQPQVSGGAMLRRGHHSGIPALRRMLEGSDWSHRTWLELQQAGLPLKVGEYLIVRLSTALFAALLLLFVAGGNGLGLVLTVVAGVFGFFLPAFYVGFKKGRRQQIISKQMVETLHLVSNALRSGFAFTQAVEMAAKQLPPPIQDELNRFLRDINLGAKIDDALKGMVERTGSVDVEMLVTTIMVQRVTGGNLSEVLDNVAATVRERQRLHAEILALTGQQRLTGFILSVYPIILGLLFFAIAPSIWKVLVTENVGRVVLGVAGFLQLMGILWIRQILKLDV